MKRKITGIFIVIAIVATIVLAVRHCGDSSNTGTAGIDALPRPDLIRTAQPRFRDFTETRIWFGIVRSRDKAKIIALENGRIVSINAGDGIPVSRGDLIFTIGGPLIDSRREVLKNQADTLSELIPPAEQMVKIKRDALSRRLAKFEELAAAEDALARLRSELEAIRQETERLREAVHLRAPVGGVFTNRKVSSGQEVRNGDGLAEIISQNHIYIEATLFPRSGDAELKKKPAVINLSGGNFIQGNIITVLPRRTATGATVVWIEGDELAPVLRPGQIVTGTVLLSAHEKALALPPDAIVRDDEERAYVFLKDSSGYRRKSVRTGNLSDGWVEIISGLKEGDEVVVRGAYELFFRDFNKIYKVAD